MPFCFSHHGEKNKMADWPLSLVQYLWNTKTGLPIWQEDPSHPLGQVQVKEWPKSVQVPPWLQVFTSQWLSPEKREKINTWNYYRLFTGHWYTTNMDRVTVHSRGLKHWDILSNASLVYKVISSTIHLFQIIFYSWIRPETLFFFNTLFYSILNYQHELY